MLCLLGFSGVARAEGGADRALGLSHIAERLGKDVPSSGFGPLLGSDGRVMAIVSRKLVKRGFEGIAFGVPIQVALPALEMKSDVSTSLDLTRPAAVDPADEAEGQPITDQADPIRSIDPESDERRREAARATAAAAVEVAVAEASNRDRALAAQREPLEKQPPDDHGETALGHSTPNYIPVLRVSGIALAGVGLLTALVSSAAYDASTSTKKEYETMRLWNDLGWASVALGGGAFGASFLLTPPHSSSTNKADITVPGPSHALFVRVRGTY